MHKSENVLEKMPKAVQPRAKDDLHQIWMAETRAAAEKAFDTFIEKYEAKFPRATECLAKDRTELLAFYDFPAEHWLHIRTTNPIESTFATVRLMHRRTKGSGSRDACLAMVYKLVDHAQRHWRRLNGHQLIPQLLDGQRFRDGILDVTSRDAARLPRLPYTRSAHTSYDANGGPPRLTFTTSLPSTGCTSARIDFRHGLSQRWGTKGSGCRDARLAPASSSNRHSQAQRPLPLPRRHSLGHVHGRRTTSRRLSYARSGHTPIPLSIGCLQRRTLRRQARKNVAMIQRISERVSLTLNSTCRLGALAP